MIDLGDSSLMHRVGQRQTDKLVKSIEYPRITTIECIKIPDLFHSKLADPALLIDKSVLFGRFYSTCLTFN